MTTMVDRLAGASSGLSQKAPSRVATTANITLSGFFAIDGVTPTSSEHPDLRRILVKNQTDAAANGIYIMDTGPWERAKDFDGINDIRQGTYVYAFGGSTQSGAYRVTSPIDPFTFEIDADDITFAPISTTDFADTPLYIDDGTAAAPGLAFADDTDTGLYRPGPNAIGLSAAVVVISAADDCGIELGRTDGVASVPHIDFHSSGNATDYDVRLIASGGSASPGQGDLALASGTLTLPNAGLHLLDTNSSHDLIISPGADLTADRTLTITTPDANQTLNFATPTSGYHFQADGTGGGWAGFTQADPLFSTAQTRSWGDRCRDRVSVFDFIPESLHAGIRLNTNTTDLTAYFQNALNSVQYPGPDPDYGGLVDVPKGHYKLSGTLIYPANTYLVGEGSFNTILDFATNASYGINFVANCHHFGLAHLAVKNALLDNLFFTGAPNFGEMISVESTGSRSQSGVYFSQGGYLITMDRVRARANAGFGFRLAGYHAAFSVTRCEADLNANIGFSINNISYSHFSGCGSDANLLGYVVTNAWGVTFTSCGSELNEGAGWRLASSAAISAGASVPGIKGVVLTGCFGFDNNTDSGSSLKGHFARYEQSGGEPLVATMIGCADLHGSGAGSADDSIVASGSPQLNFINCAFIQPGTAVLAQIQAGSMYAGDLYGVASIDSITEATIEAAIDTLPNLASVNSGPVSGFRNRCLNRSGYFTQAGLASTADGAYTGFDQWLALTQTGAVTPSQLTAVEDGTHTMMRMTQAQAAAQRMGWIQWMESGDCIDLRGKTVGLHARVRMSVSTTLRYAILAWTGTADSPTKDVVLDWTNATFTAGQFFNSTTLTVVATGSQALTANTLTTLTRISATMSSSLTNAAIFFWTDSTQAQNVTLDLGNVDFSIGATAATTPEWRALDPELRVLQRFYRKSYNQGVAPGTVSLVGKVTWFAAGTTSIHVFPIQFGSAMHKTPTVTLYSPATGASGKIRDESAAADVNGVENGAGDAGFYGLVNGVSLTNVFLSYHYVCNARL